MILKALYDYYDRCKGTLPAFGRELKEIGFLIVIDRDGNFLRFEDRRIDSKHAHAFIVNKQLGRTSAPVATTTHVCFLPIAQNLLARRTASLLPSR